MLIKKISYLFVLLLVVKMANANDQTLQQQLYDARKQQQPAVILSDKLGVSLSTDKAYAIQTAWLKQWLNNKAPQGFKAGLTTKGAQTKFKVTEPVAGVLINTPLLALPEKTLTGEGYNKMMIETELGFRMKQPITQPIRSIEELKILTAVVMPVIELPDLAFDKPLALTGADIIANNVIAKDFIVGRPQPITSIDINTVEISLKHNKQVILASSSGTVMENQWQALLWLVNRTLASGWQITPNQILITGAVGQMMLAKEGEYLASFSGMETIRFYIN